MTANPAIHQEIRPTNEALHPLESDHLDELDGERAVPRSGNWIEFAGDRKAPRIEVIIGTVPGVESLTNEQARARGYPTFGPSAPYIHRVAPVVARDPWNEPFPLTPEEMAADQTGILEAAFGPAEPSPTPRLVALMAAAAEMTGISSTDTERTDVDVTIAKLRDANHALTQETDALKLAAGSAALEIDWLRTSVRKSMNESAALNENMRTTHERCSELTEVVRASRVFWAIDANLDGPDDFAASERLIWQLIQLGGVVTRSIENDPGPMSTASIAMGVVMMQAADGANEDQRRKLALEIAASALRRGFAE